MLRLLILTVLAFVPASIAAQTHTDIIAEIQTGVVCAPERSDVVAAPDTISGTKNVIDHDPPFVSRKHRVPAVLGVGFGVKARAAEGPLASVRFTVVHPPMGPSRVTRQSFETVIGSNDLSLTFYQFDHAYELVLGTWKMTATQGDLLLYSAEFEVLAPDQVPELAGVCGFEALLS